MKDNESRVAVNKYEKEFNERKSVSKQLNSPQNKVVIQYTIKWVK